MTAAQATTRVLRGVDGDIPPAGVADGDPEGLQDGTPAEGEQQSRGVIRVRTILSGTDASAAGP